MHDIVTKETWSSDPDNAPLPSDFNRIESNTRKVEENRQEETDARISADSAEASTRASAVSAEAYTRSSADSTLQTNINNEAASRAAITTALMTTNAVGSCAFLKNKLGYDYASGQLTAVDAILIFSNIAGQEENPASGIWRAMGAAPLGSVTLYVKVSS